MAANPAVVSAHDGQLVPAPFPGETLALARGGIEIALDGLHTTSGKWAAAGSLWLTDIRLVFVADKEDADSGLRAFDLPLSYITHDSFKQPIFGCNHLSGKVWPAEEGGGPAGTLPPHSWRLYFKNGGVGTFLPLYYRFIQAARVAAQRPQQDDSAPSAPQPPQNLVATALVDPSDPTMVFLTQPVGEDSRLKEAPRYASIYGKTGETEMYEPM